MKNSLVAHWSFPTKTEPCIPSLFYTYFSSFPLTGEYGIIFHGHLK